MELYENIGLDAIQGDFLEQFELDSNLSIFDDQATILHKYEAHKGALFNAIWKKYWKSGSEEEQQV